MKHIDIYPDECHARIVEIELEFCAKVNLLRKEYMRQLLATNNSEEHNTVFARYRARHDELLAHYGYKQSAYIKECKPHDPILTLLMNELVGRNASEK